MLKVMIIGTGGIAPAHIEGFQKFKKEAKIVAVVGYTYLEGAQKLIDEYKLDAKASCDYKALLEEVDVVSICTPPASHREIAITCLKWNKHVLLEKPMALSLKECDEILNAAKSSSGVLSIVAQSRFIPSISKTIRMIHKGDYGKVLFSYVNSLWWRGQSYYDLAWRGRWETEGGGCTLNHAVHHIDLLLWAKGMPIEVTSVMGNLGHDNSEEEDISVSILKYEDGTMAQLTASLLHHGEKQKIDFQMERVGVSIPFEVTASKQRSNGFPMEEEEIKEQFIREYNELTESKHEHHVGQIENFLNSILTGKNPLVDGDSGRNTIELIAAIYKSASIKQTVTLPLSAEDDFYTLEGMIQNTPCFNKKTRFVDSFEDKTTTSFIGKFE